MKLFGKREAKVLSPLEGYNLWATTYQHESNPIKNLSDHFIEKNLPDLKDKSVLDAGCGTGRFCSLAEQQQAAIIVGYDLSPAMINIARVNCPLTEFRCEDLSTFKPEEKKFDVVISALVLAHIPSLQRVLSSLLNSLKQDGILLITDFHPFLTLLQAKRTFKDVASGRQFEIKHNLHLFQDYFSILENLAVIEILKEPVYNNTPVIFGMVIRKK